MYDWASAGERSIVFLSLTKECPFMSSSFLNPTPSDSPNRPDVDESHGANYKSTDLFQGRDEITIQHDGKTYRLRRTKNGKLILNK